jgi:transcriptional regulator with XRE-family HTH domain
MDGLGIRLRQERQRLGLSQASIANIGGIKANAQSFYESGRRSPRAQYLAKIAAEGVDVSYVLTGVRNQNFVFASASSSNADPVSDSETRENQANHTQSAIKIIEHLRTSIWSAAEAISEISHLMNVSDKRSPEELIAAYLEGLNPAFRPSDAVKTDQPVAKELAFEVPAVMLTGHAPTRFE